MMVQMTHRRDAESAEMAQGSHYYTRGRFENDSLPITIDLHATSAQFDL